MRSILFLVLGVSSVFAQPGQKWVASWAASAHGPYPSGNASAQPNLRFAFPDAAAGARDQSFRLIVQPDLWGRQTRLHFSNVFGARPVTFDGVFAGLHLGGGAVVGGTNRAVHFGGKASVTIPAGASVWSDPVDLPFVEQSGGGGSGGAQAGGELSRGGRERPHDVARQGADHVLCEPARRRRQGAAGGRVGIPVHHHFLVLSGRGGRDGAGRHARRSWPSATPSPTARRPP